MIKNHDVIMSIITNCGEYVEIYAQMCIIMQKCVKIFLCNIIICNFCAKW